MNEIDTTKISSCMVVHLSHPAQPYSIPVPSRSGRVFEKSFEDETWGGENFIKNSGDRARVGDSIFLHCHGIYIRILKLSFIYI